MATTPAPGETGGGGKPYTVPTTGPVTPHEIYTLLLQRGMSTNQALGVMANMINESGLDPEASAIDSNGLRSNGLVQWNEGSYPSSGSLVTNNPQKDVRAQVDYLFTHTGSLKQGLAGSSAEEVASNWAANVERCQGCQAGGSQNASRVANVAGLRAAVNSGDWSKVSTSSVSTSGGSGSSPSSGAGGTCLIPWPNAGTVTIIPGVYHQTLGPTGCMFSKSQARALIGGLMMFGGASIMGLGVVVLVASAFSGTKAGQAAAKAAGTGAEVGGAAVAAAGLPEVGAPVAAAGAGIKRAGGHKQGRAGKYARRKRTERRENRAEDAELAAKGASNRPAKAPGTLGKPTRPGRVTGSEPGVGPGSRRTNPATDKPPF